jgi:hypothetical protein
MKLHHWKYGGFILYYKRLVLTLGESTVKDCFRREYGLLEPLYECLKKNVLLDDYPIAIVSPIRVLTASKSRATPEGYQWVYYSPVKRLILVDYQKGQERGWAYPNCSMNSKEPTSPMVLVDPLPE